MGTSVIRSWRIVNEPFQPEYLGDRRWNLNSAQLAFPPNPDVDNLRFDTWSSLLKQCGKGLDRAIKKHDWCQANAIPDGAAYLKCWVASLIQRPLYPLPYLFLFGGEDCGKSTFHEALSLIIEKGVVRADNAITNQSGFNSELQGAVLCIVEETDLSKSRSTAHNRIKDWVTSCEIMIHPKGRTPFNSANSTHWVQCANSITYCPIFPGDTRITVCYVKPLVEKIAKDIFIQRLTKEAPDFIASLLQLELPKAKDSRLGLPVIMTSEKESAMQDGADELTLFIEDQMHHVEGAIIKFSDVWDLFSEWLPAGHLRNWSKIKMGKALLTKYPKGRHGSNAQLHIGNLSKDHLEPVGPVMILENDWLVQEK